MFPSCLQGKSSKLRARPSTVTRRAFCERGSFYTPLLQSQAKQTEMQCLLDYT